MVLNWPDWATGELGYVVYISADGGVTYNFSHTIGTKFHQFIMLRRLSLGTTYMWKVFAVSEGNLSTPLPGTQATLPKAPIKSITSGVWSNPASWDCTCIPTNKRCCHHSDGTSIKIDMNAFLR